MITIRAMRADDWPRVAEIFQSAIEDGRVTMHTRIPAYADWDAAHDENCRLVAVSDGLVVGWIAVSPVSKRACYAGVRELAIYVDRAMRRQGVGTLLLNALIEESERAGIWTLEAHVFAENRASRALHERCGFRLVGVREQIGFDKFGVWHDTVLYERRSHVAAWPAESTAFPG